MRLKIFCATIAVVAPFAHNIPQSAFQFQGRKVESLQQVYYGCYTLLGVD